MGDGAAGDGAGRLERWAPGLALLLAYRRGWLGADLSAGLAVAAVALPVGVAYADLLGVPVQMGLYAAIFPMVAYALFGSSRQLIVGPDAATTILLAAGVAPLAAGDPARAAALVTAATLMTGALFLMAGAARLGFVASFLSRPILAGFMNGVAVVILASQAPRLLGYPSGGSETLARLRDFALNVADSHGPTAALGLGAVAALAAARRVAPRLPMALIVLAASVWAVAALDLGALGVRLTGPVPGGLPQPGLPALEAQDWRALLGDAAGVALISFTSGQLVAQAFARRRGYDIDANQELKAYGVANLVAGLTQGFAVSGATSRTAVNDAMGGRSPLVALIAAAAMAAAVAFLAPWLALAPGAAFAAVVSVAAASLFDVAAIRALARMSWREAAISLATTAGVIVLGVLPGVVLAVALSLLWLLTVAMRPADAVLGRVEGLRGHHDVAGRPDARTVPGLMLWRFEANVVFFNADHFAARLKAAMRSQAHPVRWVVVDFSTVNVIDASAVERFDELRAELAAQGVKLGAARIRRSIGRSFREAWLRERVDTARGMVFTTLNGAIRAYEAAMAAERA
jgi:high affinity sulfate transporter 1